MSSGATFEVSNGKSGADAHTKYFTNVHAALNYIYGADSTATAAGSNNTANITNNPYYDSTTGTYTATIKLLQDVKEGEPLALGGVVVHNDDDYVKVGTAKKTNLTIDLGSYNYKFAKAVVTAGGKVKAISTKSPTNITSLDNASSLTSVTIKNGSMSVSDQTAGQSRGKFERLLKSYVNFTFEDVKIDATGLKGQLGGEDGAAINHSAGILSLKGSTTITVRPEQDGETFYAVSGKKGSSYGPIKIEVELDDDGYIPSIGMYGWVAPTGGTGTTGQNAYYASYGGTGASRSFASSDFKLDVIKGNVGEITMDGVAVDGVGWTSYSTIVPDDGRATSLEAAESVKTAISTFASKDNISIASGTFGTFENATGSTYLLYQKSDSLHPYTFGIEGWNKTSSIGNEYNYVASLSGSTQGKGEIALNVKNNNSSAIDTKEIAFDEGHKVFGVPSSAISSLMSDSYNLVKLNSKGEAVTITEANEGAAIYSGKYTLNADSITESLAGTGIIADTFKTINASDVNVAVSIRGNDLGNAIYSGKGNNYVTLGGGQDTFVYSGGTDSIFSYSTANKDIVKLSGTFDPITSGNGIGATEGGDLVLGFGENNSLNFKEQANIGGTNYLAGVTVESGKNSYVYTKQSIVQDNYALTLTSAATATAYDMSNNSTFYTIDGAAVSHALDLKGDGNNNYFVGASLTSDATGNSLYGGAGNDTLVGGAGKDRFRYTDGKDVIVGYGAGDSLDADIAKITGAKVSGNKLTFNFDSTRSITFNPVNENMVESVSLTTGEVLSKDGYTNTTNTTDSGRVLNLFEGAKGKVDAATFGATAGINASAVKSNVVTMVGASVSGTYTFADNKKADVFEYGGGSATLSGYVAGSDKINLGNNSFTGFSVNDNGVLLTLGDNKSVSIGGAKEKEILLHDGDRNKANQYSKIVFKADGVLQDKESKPTSVTVMGGASGFTATGNTIKKIIATGSLSGIAITGADVNTAIDLSEASLASDAGANAVLNVTGGTKNDKVTLGSAKEVFTYKGGKDVISGFGTGDSLAFSGSDFAIDKITKVTNNGKTITLKFEKSKDALTIKSNATIGAVAIGEDSYTFGKKNAIIVTETGGESTGTVAKLTSGFSGTYTADGSTDSINASAVTKNLTIKGQKDKNDIIISGGKKAMLKGQGGADTLVGGAGVDTFYYKKGEKGDIKITNFDGGTDKIKISGSKVITDISTGADSLKFNMDGASIEVQSFGKTGAVSKAANQVLLKANNTYYWFTNETFDDSSGDTHNGGWVTSLSKISNSKANSASGYSIVDLGYSTNLVKAGLAYKSDAVTFPTSAPTNEQSSSG